LYLNGVYFAALAAGLWLIAGWNQLAGPLRMVFSKLFAAAEFDCELCVLPQSFGLNECKGFGFVTLKKWW